MRQQFFAFHSQHWIVFKIFEQIFCLQIKFFCIKESHCLSSKINWSLFKYLLYDHLINERIMFKNGATCSYKIELLAYEESITRTYKFPKPLLNATFANRDFGWDFITLSLIDLKISTQKILLTLSSCSSSWFFS